MVYMGLTCFSSRFCSSIFSTPSDLSQNDLLMKSEIATSPAPFLNNGLRSYSSTLKRQGTIFPSALSLILSQSAQNGFVIEVMTPTSPFELSLNLKCLA